MITFKKPQRMIQEYQTELDPKLKKITELAAYYLELVYGIELVITDIIRTQEEQDNIYGNNKDKALAKKYKANPWNSVHQYGRGIDFRTSNMTTEQAQELADLLNKIVYDEKRPEMKTAKYGDSLHIDHIHVQVKA